MGAPIATLKDNFTDNLIANAWAPVAVGSATYSEASGRATITLPSSVAGSHEAAYVSTSQYDLTGGNCYININGMVATGVAATAYFDLRLDNNNYLRWRQISNTITARKVVAGVDTQLYTATWSATTYKYLRIRESGGTVFFDSSTDGSTWTNRASIVGLPFAVTDLKIWMGALCGNIAAPGLLTVEDINLILPALTTTWRWTQIVWPLTERFRTITLALDTAGTAQAYVAFSDSVDVNGDPVSPTYWSGPADGGRELTSQATQAAAQAMAVNIPLDGRFDLPTLEEGRVIRVYHRSIDGSAYTLREVYPRRLVQADDIEAEVVRGLRVEGHQFICDYLSALSADVGYLTAGVIDGVIIYAGGATHAVTLDTDGITLLEGTNDANTLKYETAAGVKIGELRVWAGAGTTGRWTVSHASVSGQAVELEAFAGTTDSYLTLNVDTQEMFYIGDDVGGPIARFDVTMKALGGLNVGPATAAADAAIELGSNSSGNRNAFLDLHGDDTYTDYGLRIIRANGGANTTSSLVHRGTGALRLMTNEAGAIEFYINNTLVGSWTTAGNFNLISGNLLTIASTQILTTRRTGYTNAMTGTANRATSYATSTITLVQLAERMKALLDDLTTHGIIGV
jgi:hypothetical protein